MEDKEIKEVDGILTERTHKPGVKRIMDQTHDKLQYSFISFTSSQSRRYDRTRSMVLKSLVGDKNSDQRRCVAYFLSFFLLRRCLLGHRTLSRYRVFFLMIVMPEAANSSDDLNSWDSPSVREELTVPEVASSSDELDPCDLMRYRYFLML